MTASFLPDDSQRPLDSDHLGEKGEGRFREICIDAMLFPNKSYYDRTGWDFVIDWQHLPGSWTLDNRPTPISCMVQTKTVWAETKSITFLVSSLERLAKDLRPSFVFVLKVNNQLEFVGGHIIHIEGDFLEHVLRKLREVQIVEQKPNDVTISISLEKWAQPHAIIGSDFRTYVEAVTGGAMSDYATRKQQQLVNLGYENGRLHIKAKVDAASIDELADAFLGLKPIKVSDVQRFDMRFDMPVPIKSIPGKTVAMEFTPDPFDTGDVILSGSITQPAARFKIEMYRVALDMLPGEHTRILLRSKLFRLMLIIEEPEEGERRSRLQFSPEIDYLISARLPAATWRNFFRMMGWIASGQLTIEIDSKHMAEPISGAIDLPPAPERAAQWEQMANLAEAAHLIFERVDGPGTGLKLEDLIQAAEGIFSLQAMLTSPTTLGALSFTTSLMSDAGQEPERDADMPRELLYFNGISFGKHRIVFAAIVDLAMSPAGEGTLWSAKGSINRIYAIRRIPNREELYDRFIETCRKAVGMMSHIAMAVKGGN